MLLHEPFGPQNNRVKVDPSTRCCPTHRSNTICTLQCLLQCELATFTVNNPQTLTEALTLREVRRLRSSDVKCVPNVFRTPYLSSGTCQVAFIARSQNRNRKGVWNENCFKLDRQG